jgi:hypothetical protein
VEIFVLWKHVNTSNASFLGEGVGVYGSRMAAPTQTHGPWHDTVHDLSSVQSALIDELCPVDHTLYSTTSCTQLLFASPESWITKKDGLNSLDGPVGE